MSSSILTSTKKNLGIDADYTAFDQDILMHINSVFMILSQTGIGPADGFMIEDDSTMWDAFLATDINLNVVKTYMYLRVRLLFDPPTTSYMITAMNEQIRELEWRMNVHREATQWVDPNPVIDPDLIIDGGTV